MKKLLLLAAFAFAFTACSSDDDSSFDCNQQLQIVVEASIAYSTAQTAENCADLKSKIQTAIDNNCEVPNNTTGINSYAELLASLPEDCNAQ